MNWADYAILAILALSVLVGLWRGLATEVMALVIWIAAFWAAWLFGPTVTSWFRGSIEVPSVRIILGYVVCFVVVLLLGALLRFVINRLVESTGLSGSDRLLGMVFGLARGVLLVALLVFLLGFTPFTRDAWWHQSRLLPTFISTADWLGSHVPADIQRYLHTPSDSGVLVRVPEANVELPKAAADLHKGAAQLWHSLTPAKPGSSQPPPRVD